MESHPNRFDYDPLPAGKIRLVILPPRGLKGWLDGSLIDVNIADCGTEVKYNALSYTWGDAAQTSYIRLTSGKRVGELRVTNSVIEALHRVRHDEFSMAFWVDQICIDQTNAEERESQIMLMKLIYERAGSIHAWIGGAKDDSDLAMDVLRSDKWQQVLVPTHDLSNTGADGNEKDGETFTSVPVERQRILVAIANLMRRPWWTRAWILQEATAQTAVQTLVCCGSKQLELSRFFQVILTIQKQILRPADSRKDLQIFYDNEYLAKLMYFGRKRANYQLRPFLELLENVRNTEATDARDKIYVMIPFAHETMQANCRLRAQYGQLPEEAYVEFALWHIHQSQSLDVLGHCSPPRVAFTDILSGGRSLTTIGAADPDGSQSTQSTREWYNPSWAPDWRRAASFHAIPKRQKPDEPFSSPLFSAGGKLQSPFKIPESNLGTILKLKVKGVKVGEVGLVQTGEPDGQSIWEPLGPDYKCPFTNLPMRDVYIRTIYTDLKAYGTGDGEITWRRVQHTQELSWPVGSSESEGVDVPDMVVMRRHCTGRRLYHTRSQTTPLPISGIFGLGPNLTQAGDELWVLEGGSVPFILRPRTIDYNTNNPTLDLSSGVVEMKSYKAGDDLVFEVIGETFVLGLVDLRLAEMTSWYRRYEAQVNDAVGKLSQTDRLAMGAASEQELQQVLSWMVERQIILT